MNRDLEAAIEIARHASTLTLEYFRSGFVTEYKDKHGDDPVTSADRAANTWIVDELSRRFPEDRIIAEESGASGPPDSPRVWFVDPIDGTKEFVAKTDQWSVMIGLVENGRPVMGVVAQPPLGVFYYAAQGEGAFREDADGTRRIRANAVTDPSKAVLANSRTHRDPRRRPLIRRLGIERFLPHGSVGLKMSLIAEGRADLYFNFSRKCSLWDLAAGEAILKEAGGEVRALSGSGIDYSAKNGALVDYSYLAAAKTLAPVVLRVVESDQ